MHAARCRCWPSPRASTTRPRARPARPRAPTTPCPSTPSCPTWPGRCGATTPTASPSCWPRCGRCSCSCRCSCSAGAARARRSSSRAAALVPIVLLFVVALFDRELFEVRYFLVAVPLLFLLVARLVTGWIRSPRGAPSPCGGHGRSPCCSACSTSRLNDDNPRLFDFRGAIEEIEADAGPRSLVIYEPPDMRYVLEYYAPELRSQPLSRGDPRRRDGAARSSCSPRSRTTRPSSTGRTRSSGSSTSSAGSVQTVQDAADAGVESSDEHPPVGRPAAQGDLGAGAEVGQRAHAGADHGRCSGCPAAVWYFGWLLNPDRIGDPVPLRDPDRGRALQPQPGARLLVDLRERARARAQGRRASGWPSTSSCPVYKEPPEIVDLTVAAAAGLRGAEVRVHVLDDGNDPAMRDLAARHGVGYITPRASTPAPRRATSTTPSS